MKKLIFLLFIVLAIQPTYAGLVTGSGKPGHSIITSNRQDDRIINNKYGNMDKHDNTGKILTGVVIGAVAIGATIGISNYLKSERFTNDGQYIITRF